jgi:endonuclease YncB( thermonuclease family)
MAPLGSDRSIALHLLMVLALGIGSINPIQASEYRGRAVHVADGDTFTLRTNTAQYEIRLCGVDAP